MLIYVFFQHQGSVMVLSSASAPVCDLKPWKRFTAQSTHSACNPLNTCISGQRQRGNAASAVPNAFLGGGRGGDGWVGELVRRESRGRPEEKGLFWVRLQDRDRARQREESGGRGGQKAASEGKGESRGERGGVRAPPRGIGSTPMLLLQPFFFFFF